MVYTRYATLCTASSQRHSVLIFCYSRAACQSCAALVADLLPPLLPSGLAGDDSQVAARAEVVTGLRE